ncbi:PREDICTED: centrosomal protein of 164 kDa isoform X2 [Nicrophorus vespilloides]|uniref:Centrosomal protein of 164 kDa isoform X2 n=1 Tax=Nicrophorus vespilloides TaxID=110193 RepID=A0ABM1NAR7_NICVS|nr:PREDICTED: centrosomal protein of 164 kDa isoform X2 [Nicrophorus vespilloides]
MSTANSVVCEEIFDESSHPSNDEIRDYATKIGIDPESEPQFLPLAAEGLMRALPAGWKPCLDEKSKSYYYYNNMTGKTQWEHPLDNVYRGLVKKKRTESQSLSIGEQNEDATYTRDDLPSLEEPPFMHKQFESLSLGARKKEPKLSPMKARLEDFTTPKLIRQKSEEKPIAAYVNRKISLSLSSSFDTKNIESPKKEFKLLGGGSMFLKKKGSEQKEAVENEENNKIVKNSSTSDIIKSKDESLLEDSINKETQQPRGILRERSFVESINKSIEEDDKKNVRFNLQENADLMFDFSDKSLEDEVKFDVKLTKAKPRFSNSPVKDVFRPNQESDPKSLLKLIKPNPIDFVKPKIKPLESETSAPMSDSEDDSILKSIERVSDKKGLDKDLQLSEENCNNITEKYREDNMAIIKQLKESADRELEDMKKTIWNEKNEEISKYKNKLQESQKNELERILLGEKSKYEENIKRELENLRVEMESRNLGALEQEKLKLDEELNKSKQEMQSKFKIDESKIEEELILEYDVKKSEIRKKFDVMLEEVERNLGRDLEQHKDELIVSHNAILDQVRKNHQAIMDEIKQDYKSEEKIIRKEHENQIIELKKKVSGNIDMDDIIHKNVNEERLYEKVRCEKRLLEDKYRCLKEKYLRLKTDVKLTMEKRNRKREQSATTTTGSETERSNSINKEKSPNRMIEKPPILKTDPNRNKPEHKVTRTIIIQDLDTSTSDRSGQHDEKLDCDSSEENANAGRSRKRLFSRLKTTASIRTNNNKKRTQRSCSPVENLRRQLQKLEDLEDQFPQNAQADTYHLRYPFSDGQKFEGSSELEFFRHRIHLERDSIKRAKESLRTQKCLFQQRQNDLKLKHGSMARNTLQQLCQEERDLTDMEVSLHRTRSLLGEKVIRLRHLEQSLQRATAASNDQYKQDETTLSDLSSHSASSGISSTEFATAADGAKTILRGEHLQESSEIIQSLENLNSEIREIWEVLNQQQAGNMASVYPDLGWPVLAGTATVPAPPSIPTLADRLHNYRQHVALANAQSTVVTHAANQGATTTLVERTRNLRHWLRQAGVDPGTDGASPQATL